VRRLDYAKLAERLSDLVGIDVIWKDFDGKTKHSRLTDYERQAIMAALRAKAYPTKRRLR